MPHLQLWIEQPDGRSIRKQRTRKTPIDQSDLTDKILHSTTEWIAHGTFSNTDNMLGQKISHNKFKIKIIQSIFSIYNRMKVEINNERKTENA